MNSLVPCLASSLAVEWLLLVRRGSPDLAESADRRSPVRLVARSGDRPQREFIGVQSTPYDV
jgi:hypothetical protein